MYLFLFQIQVEILMYKGKKQNICLFQQQIIKLMNKGKKQNICLFQIIINTLFFA